MKLIYLIILALPLLFTSKPKAVSQTPFPAFEYPDTAGKKVSLNSVKGKKATLIVFWASWCAPCRKEIPALKMLYSNYKAKGLSVVSVSVDEKMAAWKKAVSQEHMPWPNLANLPSDGLPVMDQYKIEAVPQMILIDSNNEVLFTGSAFDDAKQKVEEVILKP
jgi:peroxiredoxin